MTLLPTLLVFAGALACLRLPFRARAAVVVVVPLLAAGALLSQAASAPPLLREPVLLFGGVFCFALLTAGLFALPERTLPLPQRRQRWFEISAAFFHGGCAIGVVLAQDWMTLFLFWEGMTLAALAILWLSGRADAFAAGMRYGLVHLVGGVILLLGIVGLALESLTGVGTGVGTGAGTPPLGALTSLPITALPLETTAQMASRWLILAGVLINAGAVPLSAWVTDAYPRASASGMAFLTSFTTKAAVFVLLRCFAGDSELVAMGALMALYGAIYALWESDSRRLLAYSLVGQVGLMVAAIGVGTPLALTAAGLAAVGHVVYKSLMVMAAGVVLRRGVDPSCNSEQSAQVLRALPLARGALWLGCLSLGGMPLFAGFAGKALILSAVAQTPYAGATLMLQGVAAASVLYCSGKLLLFFSREATALAPLPEVARLSGGETASLGLLSVVCVALGLAPVVWMPEVQHTYDAGHLLMQVTVWAVSVGGLWAWRRRQATQDEAFSSRPLWDTDRFYADGLAQAWVVGQAVAAALMRAVTRHSRPLAHRVLLGIAQAHRSDGPVARAWLTSTSLLWILLLLSLALLGFYSKV